MNGWFVGGIVGVVIGIFLFFVGFGCELGGEGCQTYQGKAYFYSSYGLIYIINWIQEIDFFDNFQTVITTADLGMVEKEWLTNVKLIKIGA